MVSYVGPAREQVRTDEDIFIGGFPSAPKARLRWENEDANANFVGLSLPEGGAVDVPVMGLGIGLVDVDLGMFDGFTQPFWGVIDADRDSYVGFHFSGDDVAVLRMRLGSAGTVRSHIIPDVADDTFAMVGGATFTGAIIIADDISIAFGSSSDTVFLNRSTALAADTELTNVIVGTSDHQGVAANSGIISNVTSNGDLMFLVSDAGNSKEFLYADGTNAAVTLGFGMTTVEIGIGGTVEISYTTAALAFQQATTITASGQLTFNVSNGHLFSRALIMGDDVGLFVGSNQDAVILLDSSGRVADAELAAVIVGISDHQGFAANSLIISNTTTDGDMIFLVSDGGNSLEFLLADADVAFLHLGFGMINTTIYASGDITIASSAGSMNVTLNDDDADSLDFANSAASYYLIDTRNTVAGTVAHTFDSEDATIASGAANRYFLTHYADFTLNYTGGTQVTTRVVVNRMSAMTIAGDVALTVDSAATWLTIAPSEGNNITLTNAIAIHINNAGGTPVNQHGIHMSTMTSGTTANYGITIGNTDADQNLIHAGVTGDPIFFWDESEDSFALNKGLLLAGTFQASGATEIGISVNNTALTVGSLGSLIIPVKTDTGAPNDAAMGNVVGALAYNSFDDTLEIRDTTVDVPLSVGVAGYVIQRNVPALRSLDGWYHPQQYLEGNMERVDETRCVVCGEQMEPGDQVTMWANGWVRNHDLHAIFGHMHLERDPTFSSLEERIEALEEVNRILSAKLADYELVEA